MTIFLGDNSGPTHRAIFEIWIGGRKGNETEQVFEYFSTIYSHNIKSDKDLKEIKIFCKGYCSNLMKKWASAGKKIDNFYVKYAAWLDQLVPLPNVLTKQIPTSSMPEEMILNC